MKLARAAWVVGGIAVVAIACAGIAAAHIPNDENTSKSDVYDAAEPFLITLRDIEPQFVDYDDVLLDELATETCSALDKGVTPEQIWAIGAESLGPELTSMLIIVTAQTRCEEHAGTVLGWAGLSELGRV